jgi:hypothetical protein
MFSSGEYLCDFTRGRRRFSMAYDKLPVVAVPCRGQDWPGLILRDYFVSAFLIGQMRLLADLFRESPSYTSCHPGLHGQARLPWTREHRALCTLELLICRWMGAEHNTALVSRSAARASG